MLQRYFNRERVYVRDIKIEDTQYGQRQKVEIAFEKDGVFWTGYHSGKVSDGLSLGWNTVRFETTKVLSETTEQRDEEGYYQPATGEVQLRGLKLIKPDIFSF